jgi:hypothetical protein
MGGMGPSDESDRCEAARLPRLAVLRASHCGFRHRRRAGRARAEPVAHGSGRHRPAPTTETPGRPEPARAARCRRRAGAPTRLPGVSTEHYKAGIARSGYRPGIAKDRNTGTCGTPLRTPPTRPILGSACSPERESARGEHAQPGPSRSS